MGTPDAFVLYSGDEAAYRAHRAVLDLLGEGTFVGGAPDLSAVYDTAVLSGMHGMFAGFFQAVALGHATFRLSRARRGVPARGPLSGPGRVSPGRVSPGGGPCRRSRRGSHR
ncbi:hypothetical protein [Streptomyces sp. NPDC012888]|uniref:hypothetical protein n=1 Tax=Streptomyces sp. NPDC012888 TaxID=3364855 RepID=UPI00367C923C